MNVILVIVTIVGGHHRIGLHFAQSMSECLQQETRLWIDDTLVHHSCIEYRESGGGFAWDYGDSTSLK
jgi:hypothetical protein